MPKDTDRTMGGTACGDQTLLWDSMEHLLAELADTVCWLRTTVASVRQGKMHGSLPVDIGSQLVHLQRNLSAACELAQMVTANQQALTPKAAGESLRPVVETMRNACESAVAEARLIGDALGMLLEGRPPDQDLAVRMVQQVALAHARIEVTLKSLGKLIEERGKLLGMPNRN